MDKLANIMTVVKKISAMDTKKAEELGYDCGKNGANMTNCHFTIFSKPEYTKAWEKGKAEAARAER